MNRNCIIVNQHSNNARKVMKYFEGRSITYYLIDQLEKKIKEGYKNFIICGGDGTINKFINTIMKLSKKERRLIRLGIVPCGRANDLARYMKIPLDVKQAFNKIKEKHAKKIDLIKVNNNYIITGGGIGLPSETVQDVDKFSSSFIGKYLKKLLGDFSYLLLTLKKFIFGYKGVELKSKEKPNKLLAIYVLNQSFIGKRFILAPKAKNNDGMFDIVIVRNPPSFSSRFKTLSKGVKGLLSDLDWVSEKKARKISIQLNKTSAFMGDGELLNPSKKFQIEIIPKAITLFT